MPFLIYLFPRINLYCTTAHPTTMNVVYLKGPIMGGGFGLHESLTMQELIP